MLFQFVKIGDGVWGIPFQLIAEVSRQVFFRLFRYQGLPKAGSVHRQPGPFKRNNSERMRGENRFTEKDPYPVPDGQLDGLLDFLAQLYQERIGYRYHDAVYS